MAKLIDLTGVRFNRLVVAERVENSAAGQARWRCLCDCGREVTTYAMSLKRGVTRSCGCLRRELVSERRFKHGLIHTAEYRAWANMWKRCNNSDDKMYHRYGARGITVCDRWRDFAAFYADMGPKPAPALTLERKNGDSNYTPDNCVWDTRKTQSRNRAWNRYVTYHGKRVPVTVAVEMAGHKVDARTARARLNAGWSVAEAVERPADTAAWDKRRAR